MGLPAAKQGDQVTATDMHIIVPPSGPPAPVPHPFTGVLDTALSTNVKVMGMPAATVNSKAANKPPHLPIGGTFQKPPHNTSTIVKGSATVFISGQAAARNGDTASTCNDPADLTVGTVVAAGTVLIG
jgi:uncharacterized Zn-binding protein involved in type VI secretion